jgi:predicted DNA-binding transcriptional regulator AlpA
MSDPDIDFPQPFRMNGRLYWRRSELEFYKRAIIRQATGATGDPEPVIRNDVETFVTAEQVTKEFGFGRRTLGRRIAPQAAPHSAKIAEAV